ncbi:IclR family transcriptional regulator, partial [Burkholderia multivorans]
ADPALLEAELDRIAHRGLAIDNEEFVPGIVCIAAPIVDAQGACVAAVAVHAPVSRAPLSRLLDSAPRVQEAARALAETF